MVVLQIVPSSCFRLFWSGPVGSVFDPEAQTLVSISLLVLCPGWVQAGAAPLSSVPSSELHSGVGSSSFSAPKPPTIVCRARNEPTQRSIKPGSSQPTVPLTPNCPLSLVCVCVSVCLCVCVCVCVPSNLATSSVSMRRYWYLQTV